MYLKKPYHLGYYQKLKIAKIVDELNIKIETKEELLTLITTIKC